MASCRATKKILLGGFIGNTISKVKNHESKHLPCAVLSDKEAGFENYTDKNRPCLKLAVNTKISFFFFS